MVLGCALVLGNLSGGYKLCIDLAAVFRLLGLEQQQWPAALDLDVVAVLISGGALLWIAFNRTNLDQWRTLCKNVVVSHPLRLLTNQWRTSRNSNVYRNPSTGLS